MALRLYEMVLNEAFQYLFDYLFDYYLFILCSGSKSWAFIPQTCPSIPSLLVAL